MSAVLSEASPSGTPLRAGYGKALLVFVPPSEDKLDDLRDLATFAPTPRRALRLAQLAARRDGEAVLCVLELVRRKDDGEKMISALSGTSKDASIDRGPGSAAGVDAMGSSGISFSGPVCSWLS